MQYSRKQRDSEGETSAMNFEELALIERVLGELLAEIRASKDSALHSALEAARAELSTALKAAGVEPDRTSEISKLQETLRNAQDRGCALAGVAFLDFASTEMLRAHMIDEAEELEELFHPSGPPSAASGGTELRSSLSTANS